MKTEEQYLREALYDEYKKGLPPNHFTTSEGFEDFLKSKQVLFKALKYAKEVEQNDRSVK